jgi:intracellular septation protein
MNSKTRLFLDLAPLAAFFIAYQLHGLEAATACIIVVTLISLAYIYVKERTIAPMPLITGIAVTLLGGLTLYLQDETFIKIKPTVVNLVFAGILFVGHFMGKPILKYLLDHAFKMDDLGWRKLSLRWGIFFIFLAGVNEVVWRNFSTDFWVDFKVFGMMMLTMGFTLCQLPLMKEHMILDDEDEVSENGDA